jgi:orotidine-5'-phosphate decarboxylase
MNDIGGVKVEVSSVVGRSWVRASCRVKANAIKLVFVASLLSTSDKEKNQKTDGLE